MNRRGARPRTGCIVYLVVVTVLFLLAMGSCAVYTFLRDSVAERQEWDPGESGEYEEEWVREPDGPVDDRLPDLTGLAIDRLVLNSDTVGWLRIPDTGIDDVVHEDPDVKRGGIDYFYLSHDKDGNESQMGSYVADYRASFGASRRNDLRRVTTIYAHSFREDPASGMFSGLKYFKDEAFARAHPYLYFSMLDENLAFEVIAVFEAHTDLSYNRYDLSELEFGRMMEAVLDSSLYDYEGAEVTEHDRLLVLSTCAMTVQGHDNLDPYTTPYRFVVMGKLVPVGAELLEEARFTVNPDPAPPDKYRES